MHARNRIKILFDAETLIRSPKSGVGYYTWGLVEHLAGKYPDNVELVGHYCNFLGSQQDRSLPVAPNIRYKTSKLLHRKVLNMARRLGIWIPFELLTKEKGDFHLFPAFIGWPSLFRTPSAPMIHDVTFIEYPELVNGPVRYDLQKLVPQAIRRASFVITNSHASETALKQAYDLGDRPIVVGHIPPVNATHIDQAAVQKELHSLGVSGKFILFLGNMEPRKNLVRLLTAYSQLDTTLLNEYSLVLAGGPGWKNEEINQTIEKIRSNGCNVITTGYVTETQRAALFSSASIFTLVSVYEGFGMPLLEAMTYQTPMLVSRIPAHIEVANDAALFCDPADTNSIREGLMRLLTDTVLRAQLVTKGTARLKDFSWDTVTQEVYEHIKRAIS